MRVLVLSPHPEAIKPAIEQTGDEIVSHNERLLAPDIEHFDPDWIISYGFGHIIRRDVIDLMPERIINLHISLLPWNRGADPNLWSWIEDTPKGVTIHQIDGGVDTGPILAQCQTRIPESPEQTLATSYQRLKQDIESLFCERWPLIRNDDIAVTPQSGDGTFHYARHKEHVASLLHSGWDTPVTDLLPAQNA